MLNNTVRDSFDHKWNRRCISVCFLNHSGHQAANNFRNATDEAKNRSGYSSGNQSPSSNRAGSASSTSSSGYGSTGSSYNSTSGQTTTDKIKEKASEFADQAKSTVSTAIPCRSIFQSFLLGQISQFNRSELCQSSCQQS